MKILFVCNFPIDESKVMGGVEAAIYSLMETGRVYPGNHSLFFLRTVTGSDKKLRIEKSGPLTLILPPNYFFLRSIFKTRRIIREIVNKEKIQIINFIGSGPMLLKIPCNLSIPIVVTQHGIIYREMKLVGILNKPKFLFKTLVDKVYLPMFQNRIFISEYIKNLIGKADLFYVVIPNAVYIPSKILSEKIPVQLKSFKEVIIVGNISRLKNQILAVKALQKLLDSGFDFKIIIIGNVKELKYAKELRSKIGSDPRLPTRVEIIEGLNRNNTLYRIQGADVVLLTSLHEHLPMVIGESMMLGKIVVAPVVGGIPEMITNQVNGYTYKLDNSDSLCRALIQALKESKENNCIKKAARDWALNLYSPEIVFDKTISFFQKLI